MSTKRPPRPTKGRPETFSWNQRGWLAERGRMLVHRLLSVDGLLVVFSAWLCGRVALAEPARPRDVLLFTLILFIVSQLNLTSRWLLPKLADKLVQWKTGAPPAP